MNLKLALVKIDVVIACVTGMFSMACMFIIVSGIATEYVVSVIVICVLLVFNLVFAVINAVFAFRDITDDFKDMPLEFYIGTHIVRACANLPFVVLWLRRSESVLSINISIFSIILIAAILIGVSGMVAAFFISCINRAMDL